jgi:ActR/RegA family two-component response regulator
MSTARGVWEANPLVRPLEGARIVRMADKRILIVDRNTAYRERLRRQFSDRGWSVVLAGTVAEATARVDPPPHCILRELALGDGPREMLLRQVVDDDLPTRVILCTGASDPIRQVRAARLPPEAVFGKPVDIEEVLGACEATQADAC